MAEVSVTELVSLETQQWHPSFALHLPKGEKLSSSWLLMHGHAMGMLWAAQLKSTGAPLTKGLLFQVS